MIDMNLEAARLIEVFHAAHEEFRAEHARDYQSAACASAYDKRCTARDAAEEILTELLDQEPLMLAGALRFAGKRS